MQKHSNAVNVWIGIEMIDSGGIECARAANDAVHFIVFLEQEVGQITSILSGDASDKRLLHVDPAL